MSSTKKITMKDIFTTEVKSIRQFLGKPGQGYYIPAYQRPYAWDQTNISRFLEDTLHGIRRLMHRPQTISFLGTIIVINDIEYKTINPIYKTEVPTGVMTIIDGQQRICTAIMLNISLHNYIHRSALRFQGKSESHFLWIVKECNKLLTDLTRTYLIDQHDEDHDYRYYPRVIRSYSDVWSTKEGEAKYESPIAKLIWEYITESDKSLEFKFKPTDQEGNIIDSHKIVHRAFDFIQQKIGKICESNDDKYDFPELLGIIKNRYFIERKIWNNNPPEEVEEYLIQESKKQRKSRDANYFNLLRAIILARYLNNCAAVTIIKSTNEDDAFDMFEALNTTGQLLTAFETFKPKIIESENISKYLTSPSYRFVAKIDEYLDRNNRVNDKKYATSEMLISFALAETGFKLGKDLGDQRRYLRTSFDTLHNDIDKKRSFVKSIAGIAEFMNRAWNPISSPAPSFHPLRIDDEEARVAFQVLRELKHSITIAPLSRFYQHALYARNADQENRTKEFIGAIKATVAFSTLWRGAKGGTARIDSHYRSIMRVGIPNQQILPLARCPQNGKSATVSLVDYKKALQFILKNKGNIQNRQEWVDYISQIGIYRHSIPLARFLLFCASHDAVLDDAVLGLVEKGRVGSNPMLRMDIWNDNKYFTIEHIAPQSQSSGWESDIYKEPSTVDMLGNLILLPQEENSVIGNRSWEHKKLMYKLLSSDSQNKFDKIQKELLRQQLSFTNTASTILNNSKYLGICNSVAVFNKEWSLAIIQERTKRFAELVWDRLEPWLFS